MVALSTTCRCGRRLADTNEQSVTLIMIVVVFVFVVCNVPAKVDTRKTEVDMEHGNGF